MSFCHTFPHPPSLVKGPYDIGRTNLREEQGSNEAGSKIKILTEVRQYVILILEVTL